MINAHHPVTNSNALEILPKVLFRPADDDIDIHNIPRGYIAGEPDSKMFIVTDERMYRSYRRLLQEGNTLVTTARDTYLNPDSSVYSDRNWDFIGVHCFLKKDIPEEILGSIKFIDYRGKLLEGAPVHPHKEF